MVVSELRGEKIDIIPWNTEPARFVAKALSPARVREVYIDDESRDATVVVPDDQLALAIGKEGLNARLAARLTGWKVDIVSDSEFAQQEAEAAFGGGGEGGDFTGRCAAILSNGKRCPNTTLPGSRFCGVAAHQELAKVEAETGEYAPNTVTPNMPAEEGEEGELGEDGEEGVAATENGAEPVADQAAEAPVEPIETGRYEAPELKDEAPPAAADPADAVAEVLVPSDEPREDTTPAA
jgi:N utilization substance protein A